MSSDQLALLGRDYLKTEVREVTGLPFNEAPREKTLLINARANPLRLPLARLRGKTDFALLDRGQVVMSVAGKEDLAGAVSPDGSLNRRKLLANAKHLERIETEVPILFRYPWDLLEANESALAAEEKGKRGSRLLVSPDAEVEEFVAFEVSRGPVRIAEDARIEAFSRLSGPCYIGPGTVIRSALVRGGTTIGANCRVGGEVDHSIVYPFTNKAHSGYLGHSIVGEWVNMGAGSSTSDLKSTYGTVRVVRGTKRVDTGLQKLGAMIGDMSKISIGTMIYGGKSIGISSHCAGVVDRDIDDFASYGARGEEPFKLTLQSVMATQQRMMSRRGVAMSRARTRLIERLYADGKRAATRRSKGR
jgi:UDP-N-acetylglucosamine diphosphorylase/glucosamine-1-phosphate N-acetyltransferase